ncbi:MAG: hypothetical protein J6U01_03230 [Clostridia bacterium]|nr:hypothetical protein [Clostridia bacterium]
MNNNSGGKGHGVVVDRGDHPFSPMGAENNVKRERNHGKEELHELHGAGEMHPVF